jgi:hypothetical protein
MDTNNNATTRFQALRWPLIVVGLLSCHVSAMVLAINIASVGDGNAILPNYYDKALRWDELREQAAASARLDWDYTLTPSVLVDGSGNRQLRGTLTDAEGAGLPGAEVRLRVWHYEANAPLHAEPVATDSEGTFTVSLPMPLAGAWSCETIISSGADVFVDSREVAIVAPALPLREEGR